MKLFMFFVFMLFVFVKPTSAYLDPGTGSYIIQIAIASMAAGTYFFKDKIGSAITFLKKKLGKNSQKKDVTKS